jgi:hypothetical protein
MHTIALQENGIVRVWGDNNYGQCSLPATIGSCQAIAAGMNHTIVVQTVPCPCDLDGSGEVDSGDLGLLLLYYGPCGGCPADLDGNDNVDSADLGLLLLNFGPCP